MADILRYIFPICRICKSSAVSTGVLSDFTYRNIMDDNNHERCIFDADFRCYFTARENKPEKWYYSLHELYFSWFMFQVSRQGFTFDFAYRSISILSRLQILKPTQVYRQYFWAQILGQGFVGVANILVTIIPPRVAAVWFTEDELSRAIGTLLSAQVIGNALGLLIPNLTIKERLIFFIRSGLN